MLILYASIVLCQEAVRLSAAQSKVVKEAKQASFRQFINKKAQGDSL
jgi:hypothetical protein